MAYCPALEQQCHSPWLLCFPYWSELLESCHQHSQRPSLGEEPGEGRCYGHVCSHEFFVHFMLVWIFCIVGVHMRVPHYIVCHAMCIHCIFPIGDLWWRPLAFRVHGYGLCNWTSRRFVWCALIGVALTLVCTHQTTQRMSKPMLAASTLMSMEVLRIFQCLDSPSMLW